MSLPAGIGLGAAVSVAVTLLGAAVMAYLIAGEKLGQGSVGYGAMLIMTVAAVSGAMSAAGWTKRRRLMVCMCTGGVYLLVLLGCTAMFFGGQYHGVLTGAILILIGSAVAALAGMKGKNGLKRRRKIPAYR